MPTVPRRNAGYVPTAPLPSERVPSGAFQTPQPIDISPLTRVAAQIAQREREKQDELAILDADNQLGALQTDLAVTATQRRGKDALGALGDVTEQWKQRTDEIRSNLANDTQRMKFEERSAGRFQSLRTSVVEHTATEMKHYDDETTDSGLKLAVDTAIQNFKDPRLVERSIADSRAIIALYGRRNGLPPEMIEQKTRNQVSAVHAGVIGRMLANGEDLRADQYYKAVKSEVSGEAATQIEQHLEVATTEGAALRAADDIWSKLGPKGLNDPVKVATMEQEAREKYGNDPKVLKATIQELRSRAQAQNAEQTEVTAGNKATVLGAFAKGAPISSLTRSSAYLSLSGTEQEQLKSYMLDRQYNAANRELTMDAKDDAAKTRRGFAKYWEISDPTKLASMSENQVLALEPTLGRTIVGQLMTQKRSLDKKEGLLAASIDDDLFKTVADDAGLHPYEPKLDEDKRASLGRLKNMTEAEIGRIQSTTGKTLTREEKAKVMRSVIDQKVMKDVFAGTDVERVASTISRDERGKVYIPLERVNPQFRAEAINWMRSNGLVLQNESDQSALARFQRRIEKAYAARVMGTTAEELDAILRGKQ